MADRTVEGTTSIDYRHINILIGIALSWLAKCKTCRSIKVRMGEWVNLISFKQSELRSYCELVIEYLY